MMTAGIIAEYNPFHNGHRYHIEETRRAGAQAVVCVMSGCFVQRGEPAVTLPRARAQMALENGADIVISLPLPWACAGAQVFARGAVGLLEALGCVDMLSFGSECADAGLIAQAARAVDDFAVQEGLRANLMLGMGFAAARQSAVERVSPQQAGVLSNPNDSLGVEYIRALMLSGCAIKPLAVRREGAGHDSQRPVGADASASFIRSLIKNGEDFSPYMPQSAAEILSRELQSGHAPSDILRLETAILARLRSMTPQELSQLPDISEGLENRIFGASRSAVSLEQLYAAAKTKRYSHARIRRTVMSAFLGLTAQDCAGIPPYIRVLGFNDVGRVLLRRMRRSATLPVLMRAADAADLDEKGRRIFDLEAVAADLWALSVPEALPCGTEYTQEIVVCGGRS